MNAEELLQFLRSRHTVRAFEDRAIPRATLERVLEAAIAAPSPTNRQPWKFSVVTGQARRAALVEQTRAAVAEIRGVIAQGPHPDHLADYWDYFTKPIASARAFVVVSTKSIPDTLAHLVQDAGADPKKFVTVDQWNGEVCAASAAIMQLLLQAHAEGLGACWMSGPLLARDRICALLNIGKPWKMLGCVALGWPAEAPVATGRKPLAKVVEWFEDEQAAP
ncbi:MAG: nitroreductase family protein [Myxococcales bacterium]